MQVYCYLEVDIKELKLSFTIGLFKSGLQKRTSNFLFDWAIQDLVGARSDILFLGQSLGPTSPLLQTTNTPQQYLCTPTFMQSTWTSVPHISFLGIVSTRPKCKTICFFRSFQFPFYMNMAIFDKLIFIREEASVSKIEKKKSLFLQNCQQVNFFFLCFFSVALWSKEISFVHCVLHELKVWKGSNTQLAGLLLSRWRPDIGCSVVCILFGSWWFYAIREFCTKKPMACMHACMHAWLYD